MDEHVSSIPDKVTARNISSLSVQAAFNGAAVDPRINTNVPNTKWLINHIAEDIDLRIETLKSDPERQQRFIELKAQYQELRSRELPTGFELAPVMVNRIDYDSLTATDNEFGAQGIKKDFVKFVANKHADELREVGASSYMISLMRAGVILKTLFPYNVDHIMERADSAHFSVNSEIDPNNEARKERGEKSLIVNHFNNMVLLPYEVHEFKNAIKDIQCKLYNSNKPRFFLMLVPSAYPGRSGFVARPQEGESFTPLTDADVIKETLNYLDMKGSEEGVMKEEGGRQAMRNVVQEMKRLLSDAQKPSGNRSESNLILKDFMSNRKIRYVTEKAIKVGNDEGKQLAQTVSVVSQYLRDMDRFSNNAYSHRGRPSDFRHKRNTNPNNSIG